MMQKEKKKWEISLQGALEISLPLLGHSSSRGKHVILSSKNPQEQSKIQGTSKTPSPRVGY